MLSLSSLATGRSMVIILAPQAGWFKPVVGVRPQIMRCRMRLGRPSQINRPVYSGAVRMQLTDDAKDRHIAPEMSSFTDATIKDLSIVTAGQNQWVRSFILNSMLRGAFQGPAKPTAFNFLRRADSAFREYGFARDKTLAYLV